MGSRGRGRGCRGGEGIERGKTRELSGGTSNHPQCSSRWDALALKSPQTSLNGYPEVVVEVGSPSFVLLFIDLQLARPVYDR